MQSDLIQLCMARACELFEQSGRKGVFNAACFSEAFTAAAGVKTQLDGKVVAAMLCGRADVIRLGDGCHYKFILPKVDWA